MVREDQLIYLDNNATTRVDPAVVEEMLPFLTDYYGNPSSGYGFAAKVREAIETARERVAALVGCAPGEIVFTSGGTEANNAAINSALQIDAKRQHVVTTVVEHSSVLKQCQAMKERGRDVTFVGVSSQGDIDPGEIENAIGDNTAIVSMMWANNETGVLFPVEKIADMSHGKGVFFHTDAVQAVGKVPIRVSETAIHFLALSAHKFHGPKGIGALYVNKRVKFRPSLLGGSHENSRRAGTENVAGIIGMGKAAEIAAEKLEEEQVRIRRMRDHFEELLEEKIGGASINGKDANRLSNTASVSFTGIESDAVLMLLDRQGICCSAGSACKTGSPEGSHVLKAMGLSEERLKGSLRFSFGKFNSEPEVETAASKIIEVVAKLRKMSAGARISAAV